MISLETENADIYWVKKIALNKENVLEDGWPTRELVGIDASGSMFLVLQHSGDINFMKELQPAFKKSDTLFLSQYALLTDKINKSEERKKERKKERRYMKVSRHMIA